MRRFEYKGSYFGVINEDQDHVLVYRDDDDDDDDDDDECVFSGTPEQAESWVESRLDEDYSDCGRGNGAPRDCDCDACLSAGDDEYHRLRDDPESIYYYR